MTDKAKCKHCERPIEFSNGVWKDMKNYASLEHVAAICRAVPGLPLLNHEPAVVEPVTTECSYCKKTLTNNGEQWVSKDEIFPQYCFADMTGGSRIHTPIR